MQYFITQQQAALNKHKFNQIVKDHQKISDDDRHKLHELASNYPYSQIIHTLVAKANMDAKTKIAKQTLGFAAMYATDRVVLKNIIAPKQVETNATKSAKKKEEEKVAKPTKSIDLPLNPKGNKITVDKSIFEEKENDSLLSTNILADLKALKASKATYEDSLEISTKKVKKEKVEIKASTTEKKEKTKTAASKKTKVEKPKKETKKPKAKSKQVAPKAKKETKTTTTKTKKTAKASKATKPKVAKEKATAVKKSEASKVEKKPAKAATKKATKTKAAKKKEPAKKSPPKKKSDNNQSVIIDNFITKEPSITANKSPKNSVNTEDLSQPSTKFTEDLMSENLAKIMVAQGKKEKAVDIYKKLIWKFPQKKAYFATQIEELKKS